MRKRRQTNTKAHHVDVVIKILRTATPPHTHDNTAMKTRASKRKFDSVESKENDPESYTVTLDYYGTYKYFMVPNPLPKDMDIKHLEFLCHTVEVTPEDTKFYNEVKKAIGVEKYQKTETILEHARGDWRYLKPSTKAFLVKRMIDNQYKTKRCCKFLLCHCEKKRLKSFCCKDHKAICEDVHDPGKPYDYVSANKDNCMPCFLAIPRRKIHPE